jgi:hypothetical protein
LGLVSALPMIAGAPALFYFGDMLIVWPTAFYLGVPMGMALLIARIHPSSLVHKKSLFQFSSALRSLYSMN